MTEQVPAPAPTPVPVAVFTPATGSRTEQLHALYAEAKAKKTAAEAELDAITAAIKSELEGRVPRPHRQARHGPCPVTAPDEAAPLAASTRHQAPRLDSAPSTPTRGPTPERTRT